MWAAIGTAAGTISVCTSIAAGTMHALTGTAPSVMNVWIRTGIAAGAKFWGKDPLVCSVATVSLGLGVLPGFGGYFGRKMAVFGPTPNLAPTPRAATGEFSAQSLDLARPPPRL